MLCVRQYLRRGLIAIRQIIDGTDHLLDAGAFAGLDDAVGVGDDLQPVFHQR